MENMKIPESEQLINRGKIEGIDFENPLDFKEDSWGNYDEQTQNWTTPHVATFGLIRKWIQDKFKYLYNTLEEQAGNLITINNNLTEINDNIIEYSIKVKEGNNIVTHKQVHNVFRITRPESDSFWGVENKENIELRLGPFNELVEIDGEEVTISGGYIDLRNVVDPGEEIIIKIISN